MGKSAEAPQSPDPKVTIPLQGAENRRTFDYQLNGMRTNTSGPTGSQTWSRTPTFDEAGYNQALSSWNAAHPSGGASSAPSGSLGSILPYFGSSDGYGLDGFGSRPGDLAGGSGSGVYGEGGIPTSYDSNGMPTRDQFTSNNWTLNTQLSPEQQQLYDLTTKSQVGQAGLLDALTQRVGQATSSPMDFSPYGLDTGKIDPSGINQQAADAVYSQQTRYLDPQMKQDQSAMESRLADQGFVPGTPAYNQAMQNFLDTKDRAYGAARDSATTQGFNVGNQTFNQNLASQQQRNSTLQQALTNALMQRNQPLTELNAVRFGENPQMPTGPVNSPTPNLSPVDAMGAYQQKYLGDLSAYNADVSSQNGLFGNLLGLGGLMMGAPGLGALFSGMGSSGFSLPSFGSGIGGGYRLGG